MSQELLLIGNPAKRRKSRKTRSVAQRRATAKMLAANRGRRARRAPVRALSNPVRHRRRARRSVSVSRRRTRRNPIGSGSLRGIVPMLKAAGLGGAGAFVTDVAYGYAQPYLPAAFQTPLPGSGLNVTYYLGKGAFTVALGMLAKRALGVRSGIMTEGALAVLAHGAIKDLAGSAGVSLPMGYMPGGRVIPPLPISQNLRGLRKYVGAGGGAVPMIGAGNVNTLFGGSQMAKYVSAGQRETILR